LQQTHRLIVFMTNIDVRTSVTVDEIVPVTLTAEERTNLLKKQTKDTRILITRIENTLSSTSSAAVTAESIEKVELALEQSSTSLDRALGILSSPTIELDAAEVFALDAYNLAFDGARLLGISTNISADEEVVAPEVEAEVVVPVEEATTTDEIPVEEESASPSA
jgi:hypothetical protein